MGGVSPVIVAASLMVTGGGAFSLGYLYSPPTSHTADAPIVDPNAWNVPAPAVAVTKISDQQVKCDPLDVSDTAMESVLDEMKRRGWRPPGYVETAIATGNEDIETTEASYSVTGLDGDAITDKGSSTIMVLNKADADRLWNEGDTADQEPSPASAPTAPPP